MATLLRALCLLLVSASGSEGEVQAAKLIQRWIPTQTVWTPHAMVPGDAIWGKNYGDTDTDGLGSVAVNQETGDSYTAGRFRGTSVQIGPIHLTAANSNQHALVFKSTTDGDVSPRVDHYISRKKPSLLSTKPHPFFNIIHRLCGREPLTAQQMGIPDF